MDGQTDEYNKRSMTLRDFVVRRLPVANRSASNTFSFFKLERLNLTLRRAEV